VTHEYTILLGGTVIRGGDAADCSALAYAHDTILFTGSDADARAISRGDSHFIQIDGKFVAPFDDEILDAGAPATFALLDADPRAGPTHTLALVRDGRLASGSLVARR